GTGAAEVVHSEVRTETDEERGDPSAHEGLVQRSRQQQAGRRREDEAPGGLRSDSVASFPCWGASVLSRGLTRRLGPPANLGRRRSGGLSSRGQSRPGVNSRVPPRGFPGPLLRFWRRGAPWEPLRYGYAGGDRLQTSPHTPA